ncbi:MAG TPA: NAD(P)-dependent oxidoreductase [Candidatus Acidoferrum sp.]|nr:NAD(P)-dependent oxidoreductase [Candidatus Acidoferrum sp.]
MASTGSASGERWNVLVTGATGRIGFPIARELARENVVYGLARCSKPGDEERLRQVGVVPLVADIAELDVASLPSDLTHVFHAAARIGRDADSDWQKTFEVNAQVTGRLIAASRGARGFVFCSSGSTYAYQGRRPLREVDPPGVHLGNYSLSKIAGEAVARFAAVEHEVPLTIIRIFSTYGPLGGAPADRLERIRAGKEVVLHPDAPNNYNPIYEDDYVRLGIRAMEVAGSPPVVVNWAGSETVSAEEYCSYLGELVGEEVRIRYDERAPWPLWPDTKLMHEILGRTEVPWREGMRRMTEARLGSSTDTAR